MNIQHEKKKLNKNREKKVFYKNYENASKFKKKNTKTPTYMHPITNTKTTKNE